MKTTLVIFVTVVMIVGLSACAAAPSMTPIAAATEAPISGNASSYEYQDQEPIAAATEAPAAEYAPQATSMPLVPTVAVAAPNNGIDRKSTRLNSSHT